LLSVCLSVCMYVHVSMHEHNNSKIYQISWVDSSLHTEDNSVFLE